MEEILAVIESELDRYEEHSEAWEAVYRVLGMVNTIVMRGKG